MTYENPSVTADIVLYCKPKNSVLLIQRDPESDAFPGCWALPGGFMGINETTEEAAYRELEEETQIVTTQLSKIGFYDAVKRDPRKRVITAAYGEAVEDEIEGKASDDAVAMGWFEVTKLPELAFDHKHIIWDAVRQFNR